MEILEEFKKEILPSLKKLRKFIKLVQSVFCGKLH